MLEASGGGIIVVLRVPAWGAELKLLALTIDERAIIVDALEDPPDGLTELRAVLMNELQWRKCEWLDP